MLWNFNRNNCISAMQSKQHTGNCSRSHLCSTQLGLCENMNCIRQRYYMQKPVSSHPLGNMVFAAFYTKFYYARNKQGAQCFRANEQKCSEKFQAKFHHRHKKQVRCRASNTTMAVLPSYPLIQYLKTYLNGDTVFNTSEAKRQNAGPQTDTGPMLHNEHQQNRPAARAAVKR